ncbi:MAG TPA: GtrA family protein [Anaeromyxobacter sp.]|nr:GtrA family protein [Anaeromyxobacter sp.]
MRVLDGGGGQGAPRGGARALRFAAVGASGAGVNLAALHLLAGVLGLPEVVSSALAIEASILSNFVLHDAITFRDRRAGARAGPAGRLARYHAVSAVSALLQFATFVLAGVALAHAAGRSELGPLRYAAQGVGVAVGFAWNLAGSARFAWAAGRRGARREAAELLAPAVFAAVLALHVLPMWLVRWFPTQDGPLHVENVLALLRHASSPLLQAWYEVNWGAQPNWLTQAVLAGLLGVVPPVVAEKIVLSAYTILFALAFRAALPRGTRGWWAALAAFPFVHAFPFHMGFWNFCWGLALALLAFGFWNRTRGRLGPVRFAGLAALAVLLFLAHTVALAGAAVAIGSALAWRAGVSLARARRSPARRRLVLRAYLARGAWALLAAGPALGLTAAWLVAHGDEASGRIPLLELAAKLAIGYALVSIDRRELFLGAAVSLTLFVGVVHLLLARPGRGPRLRPHDGWLVAALAFVGLYFGVPDVVAAGAHVSDRFALFALVSVALWIGSGAAPLRSQRRLAAALAAVAVVALGVRLDKQRKLSAHLDEYVAAADVVGDGRVLLPIAVTPAGPRDASGWRLGYRVKPFLHAAGWIVAERGGVDLKNSQANTDHCPVRFPAGRNPILNIAGSLGRMEGAPPCVDLRAADAAAADYVLVYGATREELETPCGAALSAVLARDFEPVYLSAPRGLLEVWRPRKAETTASR